MKKVVLITGVSSGFGHAMAAAFTKAGYTVYGTVRRSVELFPEWNYLQMDVTQPGP
jgi:NADP-dependent 3-hydroxy acid dehydrogenase YdfG